MDTATVRAMLMQSFEHSGRDPILAHEMCRDDAVLDGGTEWRAPWRAVP